MARGLSTILEDVRLVQRQIPVKFNLHDVT